MLDNTECHTVDWLFHIVQAHRLVEHFCFDWRPQNQIAIDEANHDALIVSICEEVKEIEWIGVSGIDQSMRFGLKSEKVPSKWCFSLFGITVFFHFLKWNSLISGMLDQLYKEMLGVRA